MTREVDENNSECSLSSKIFLKFCSLKKCYRSLEAERDHLNDQLLRLSTENGELRRELDECAQMERFYNSAGAVADREALRERLRAKEEKLAALSAFLEEQEATIGDLTGQLSWITSTMSTKEVILCKEIGDMKLLLDDKSNYIAFLEEKIHTSELLIHELQKLRQNYRLAFASLNENILSYRTQFKAVVHCSESLLSEREKSERELSEKEDKIRKLSIFPQSPKTAIYLSQILYLLSASEKSVLDESDSVFCYAPSIKKIVETMKAELWNEESCNKIIRMDDMKVQTEINQSDSCSQFEYHMYFEHKSIQAEIHGKIYYECLELKDQMSEMQKEIFRLEDAYYKKDQANKELQKQLISAFEEKSRIEKNLAGKQNELEAAEGNFLVLKEELKSKENLLQKALQEIEAGQNAFQISYNVMSSSLISYLEDYTKCNDSINLFVKNTEETIEIMENKWNEELQRKKQIDSDYVSKLQTEMGNLHEKYDKSKSVIIDLNNQIDKLQAEVLEKTDKFKTIQEKLIKAEHLFEKINILDRSTPRKQNEPDKSEPDLLAVETSEKILHYSELIGDQWKSQEKLKDETYPKSFVKSIMKENNRKNIVFRKTIKHLTDYVHKLKRSLYKERRKMKTINSDLSTSVKSIQHFKESFNKLSNEKNFLLEKLRNESGEMERMKLILFEKDSKYNLLEYEKEKTEKVLLKIIKDLEQSLSSQVQSKESVGVGGDSVSDEELKIKELLAKNKELLTVISDLQERLDKFMNIPEKDCMSSETQTCPVLSKTKAAPEKNKNKQIELHYNGIIDKIRADLSKERTTSFKLRNNLDRMKQCHEKEINDLKLEHKKALNGLRDEFAKEKSDMLATHSKQLKRLSEKLDKVNQEKKETDANQQDSLEKLLTQKAEKIEEQMKFYENLLTKKNLELAEQKRFYENMLAAKDEDMNGEINELKVEIDNIIAKKEEIIHRTKEASLTHITHLKKKFKSINRKLRLEKSAMAGKIKIMREMSPKLAVEIREEFSQTEKSFTSVPTEYSSLLDVACQTAFFYTHLRKVDVSTQTALRTRETDTQTAVKFADSNSVTVDGAGDRSLLPSNLREHVIFGVPMARKDISINFRERIKCSIQETKGSLVSTFLNKLSPLTESRELAIHRDRSELAGHVAFLEDELLHKTEDFHRNVEMYQDTIRRQRAKVEELERLLQEEVEDTYKLRDRLALEYNRAEKLSAERRELQLYVSFLQKQISNQQTECEEEREKYAYWKNHFETSLNHRKASDELEESLKRLQEKVDTAVKYEKKILDDIKEENKSKEKRLSIFDSKPSQCQIVTDLCLEDSKVQLGFKSKEIDLKNESLEALKNDLSNGKSDLKLIFLQNREVSHLWSRRNMQDDSSPQKQDAL